MTKVYLNGKKAHKKLDELLGNKESKMLSLIPHKILGLVIYVLKYKNNESKN